MSRMFLLAMDHLVSGSFADIADVLDGLLDPALTAEALERTGSRPIDELCKVRQCRRERAPVAGAICSAAFYDDVRGNPHQGIHSDAFCEHVPPRVGPLFRKHGCNRAPEIENHSERLLGGSLFRKLYRLEKA